VQKAEKAAKATSPSGNPLLKRKRSDVDESDPKLKEFLEVMRPKSKSRTWDAEETQARDLEEPPRKVQAMELPGAESDSEYEVVPKRLIKNPSMPLSAATTVAVVPASEAEPLEAVDAEAQNEPLQAGSGLEATDEDWLRSRTNRLLDLVDPIDGVTQKRPDDVSQLLPPPEKPTTPESVKVANGQEVSLVQVIEEDVRSDGPDPTIEAIQASGRLFVRNLPYSATEDDLRRHFEVYGPLEEVIIVY
jgi:multiple RNA-binding domain-containing protein 1